MSATPEAAPRASEAPTLRLDGLCVSRGRPVVQDVSLDIPAHAITALLGPNGAGKSSLVLAVGGVLRPTAGRVLLGDVDLAAPAAGGDPAGRRRDRAGGPAAARRAHGRGQPPRRDVCARARAGQRGLDYALELFPALERRWKASARALSGGEQQMVVLAQALVSQPRSSSSTSSRSGSRP